MKTLHSPILAALPASTAAGPVFLLSYIGLAVLTIIPGPIPADPEFVIALVFALVPAVIVGFLLSFVPNAMGAYLLSFAGESSETARDPVVWMGVGGILGFGIAVLFGAFESSTEATLALILTSIVCAGICRARTRWED